MANVFAYCIEWASIILQLLKKAFFKKLFAFYTREKVMHLKKCRYTVVSRKKVYYKPLLKV